MSAGLGVFPPAVQQAMVQRARALNPQNPLAVIARWFQEKPPFATWFNKADTLTLAGSAARVVVGDTVFRIPPGSYGVLRFFANSVGSVSDSGNVRFALLVDEVPLPGWGNLIGGVSPGISTPAPLMEPLLPGQVVRVVATNLSGVPIQNVAALIRGWTWAAALFLEA